MEPAGLAFVLLVVVACFIPWTLGVIFAARRWAETGTGLGVLALIILGGPLVALCYLGVLVYRRLTRRARQGGDSPVTRGA